MVVIEVTCCERCKRFIVQAVWRSCTGFDDVALLSWLKKNDLIEATKGNLKTKCINGAKVSCVWLRKEPFDNMTLEEESEDDPF